MAWSRGRGVVIAVAAVVGLAGLFGAWLLGRGSGSPEVHFVGAARCASCHAGEYRGWQASQHARSMLAATEATALGDFDDAEFTYAGVTSRFFRRDGRFLVRTDGPDGMLAEFEVKYTFGVDPLQQYLVELPGGRLQALTIAWDARSKAAGGQRWFHLYPGERIGHTDELHWTGRQFNWNYMCADCHSTNLRKNYDAPTGRYGTTWSDVNVACEACHGPGSRHLAWAGAVAAGRSPRTGNKGLLVALTERRGVRWEVEVCAQCHSRRSQIAGGYVAGKPFLDHYLPSLLEPGLYYADGQQKEEVYIHGSFLQSKMYQRGVTCSDCHDPHTQRLRASGNAICTQCHVASKYDAESHHFHEAGSAGARCAACHMSETTYMVVDARRDHSFRVPRPDLSVKLGVPNACNGCHTERSAAWAASQVRTWYGRNATGFQDFAEAFHAGAAAMLASVADNRSQPAVVRASALARLAALPGPAALEAARTGLADPDPLVRRAALSIVEALPPGDRAAWAAPLLADPSRLVRLQAAWVLAPVPAGQLVGEQASAFGRAAEEFIASQRYLADRPENRVTLGTFYAYRGRFAEAEAEFRAAIGMAPEFAPAYVNLADLHRAEQRERDAERVLREGLARRPDDAPLHHALGLSLVRSEKLPEAVAELAQAASLAPDNARFTYVYGVALHSMGEVDRAIRTLEKGLARHPADRDLLLALATFHRDAGDEATALGYANMLLRLDPGDAEARQLPD